VEIRNVNGSRNANHYTNIRYQLSVNKRIYGHREVDLQAEIKCALENRWEIKPMILKSYCQ
jgi:hypothetical protein